MTDYDCVLSSLDDEPELPSDYRMPSAAWVCEFLRAMRSAPWHRRCDDVDAGIEMPNGKRDGSSKKLPSIKTQSKSNTSVKSESRDRTARRTHDASRDRQTQIAVRTSDKLYYRIGEVSELTDVKAHVLRYWETEFRWMAPPKSRSKQRLYRQRDIEFVLLLKRLLWDERYTIAGARQRIQELGVEDALAMLGDPNERTKPTKSTTADDTTDINSSTEWAAVRIAIDEMCGDLIALRDGLQASA